jgi:hypothetical protein
VPIGARSARTEGAQVNQRARRGSDIVLERKPMLVRDEAIKQIETVLQRADVKLLKWWVLGQPGPDVILGSVQLTDPKSVGQLIGGLLDVGDLRLQLDVFPLGTPKPDLFRVDFRTPGP